MGEKRLPFPVLKNNDPINDSRYNRHGVLQAFLNLYRVMKPDSLVCGIMTFETEIEQPFAIYEAIDQLQKQLKIAKTATALTLLQMMTTNDHEHKDIYVLLLAREFVQKGDLTNFQLHDLNMYEDLKSYYQSIPYNDYLQTPYWKGFRELAINKAGRRCQVCYSPDSLDVHHRTYVRLGYEKLEDVTVLCRDCHKLFHGSKIWKRKYPHKKRKYSIKEGVDHEQAG